MTEPEEGAPAAAREAMHRRKARNGSRTDGSADPEADSASAALDADVPIEESRPIEECKPSAEIAHHTRGRVRLKIAAANHNPDLLEQIKATFSKVPGIEYIETRPSSGSVILYYDPERHADVPGFFRSLSDPVANPAIASLMAPARRAPVNRVVEVTRQIEEEAEFLAEHSNFARAIVEWAKECDRQIKRVTNNNIDLKILVPISLAAFTFLEIGAAAATPMWVTLVIFSLNHFVELQAHDSPNDDDDKT